MDGALNSLAERCDQCRSAGRAYIKKNWRLLGAQDASVQRWLIDSGHFSELGEPTDIESSSIYDNICDIEYTVGLFSFSARTLLPFRHEKGAQIPEDALDTGILSAANNLLNHPCGRSKVFLKLTLVAIQRNQIANLLLKLPPLKNTSYAKGLTYLVFGIVCLVSTLFLPAILGWALVSAAKADATNTIVALYGIGIIAWMLFAASQKKEIPSTPEEKAFEAWKLLEYERGDWLATGARARIYFEDMLRRGLPMPVIALDVAAALESVNMTSAKETSINHDQQD